MTKNNIQNINWGAAFDLLQTKVAMLMEDFNEIHNSNCGILLQGSTVKQMLLLGGSARLRCA